MQPKNILPTIAVLSLATAAAQAATATVYDNTSAFSGFYLNPGMSEVGDEIILNNPGGTYQYGHSFQFEYYGTGFSGNETVRLRFYANDGADIGSGVLKPNSVFYDSGVQFLPEPIDVSNRNTLLYDLTFDAISLPSKFTFAITFGGIDGGETAGISIYNPPATGISENDYWFNTGSDWELRGTNGVALNFGALLVGTTVPEPSTYVLALIGGVCGMAFLRRKNRKS